MQEIRDKMFDYASVVKTLDPNAIVLGPEEWGWPGYLYSGYDQQWAGNHGDYNAAHFPDRSTNGGWDYGPWLLDQFRQREIATGKRLLDYFTCTSIRRAATAATMSLPPPNCCATAPPALSGTPTTSMKAGSTTSSN